MILSEKSEKKERIRKSSDLVPVMRAILSSEHETDRMKEHCWVIGMNNKNIIQYIELVSLGTLTSGLVSPREVFRFAISKAMANIIICHNHPSGDTEPSGEDTMITRRLIKCGNLLAIRVLDHIIISAEGGNYYSFKDESFVDFEEVGE